MQLSQLKSESPVRFGLRVVSPTTPVSEAIEIMRQQKIHHLVVLQEGSYLGVVSARDLIQAFEGANWYGAVRSANVGEALTKKAPVVSASLDVRAALSAMLESGSDALPVEENGQIVDIITVTDMLRIMEKILDSSGSPTCKLRGNLL